MTRPIRWGIVGTGKIAHAFAQDLRLLPDAELIAVGSRRADKAAYFADAFHVPHSHASYQALVDDPDVDVVYIATPHIAHCENMLLALNAGKAILCEKPFTMNAAQAEQVIGVARDKRLFVMEAMWTRFIPLVVALREMLSQRVIGDVQMLVGGMGKLAARDPVHYLFDLQNGGGLLLDATVYLISLALMLFGRPIDVRGTAHFDVSGVDDQEAIVLKHARGQIAALHASFNTIIPPAFTVYGEQGRIHVHPPLFAPTRLTVSRASYGDETQEILFDGNGMNYQAAHVMECLHRGELESRVMPLDETLCIMQTMDSLRAQWGFKYPFEA
ncbi:MAG TPA: Gfo/Idh/MocA family oxidoreductase [Anaerolineae bacterium]|nr:Gfo/Idh/MocA family oxidoreductase [Anaerolineae bacterium]